MQLTNPLTSSRWLSWSARIVFWGLAALVTAEIYLQSSALTVPHMYNFKNAVIFSHQWSSYKFRARQSPTPDALLLKKMLSLQEGMDLVHELIPNSSFDTRQWGVQDYYATNAEAIEAGTGDCDEFATMWYELFRKQGWRTGVAIGYVYHDTRNGHAVAIVQDPDGVYYVLDSNEISPVELNEWLRLYKATLTYVGDQSGTTRFDRWLNG